MVLLMVWSLLFDANTDVTYAESQVGPQSPQANKQNGTTDNAISILWCLN